MIKLPDLLRTTFHGKNIAIVWRQIQNWNSQKLFLAKKSPSQLYNSDRVSIFKVLETNLWWAACVIICLHTKTLTMESRTWKSSQNIFFTKKIRQWTKTTDSGLFQIAKITKNINSLDRLRLYLCPCLCRRPPGQLLLGIWCWQPPVLNWTPDLKKDRSYGPYDLVLSHPIVWDGRAPDHVIEKTMRAFIGLFTWFGGCFFVWKKQG